MRRRAAQEDARMTKRTTSKMHPTQAAYALARATYDTAIAAHNAECLAAGWWDRDDDEAFDLIEASAQRHNTSRLFDLLCQAERAMVTWSIENVRELATSTGKAGELPTVDELVRRPSSWKRAVDLAFRAAA
jgi:hypothetical protein